LLGKEEKTVNFTNKLDKMYYNNESKDVMEQIDCLVNKIKQHVNINVGDLNQTFIDTLQSDAMRMHFSDLLKLCDDYQKYKLISDEVIIKKLTIISQTNFFQFNMDITGYIYVAADDNWKKNNTFKIGRTKNPLENRLCTMNVSRVDNLSIIFAIPTYDPAGLENRLKDILKFSRIKGEYFQLNYSILK